METNREAGGALVVNEPQTPHDGRHASREEGIGKTEGTFTIGHWTRLATAGCQHHQSCSGEVHSKEIARGQVTRVGPRRREHEAGAHRVLEVIHAMDRHVHDIRCRKRSKHASRRRLLLCQYLSTSMVEAAQGLYCPCCPRNRRETAGV